MGGTVEDNRRKSLITGAQRRGGVRGFTRHLISRLLTQGVGRGGGGQSLTMYGNTENYCIRPHQRFKDDVPDV